MLWNSKGAGSLVSMHSSPRRRKIKKVRSIFEAESTYSPGKSLVHTGGSCCRVGYNDIARVVSATTFPALTTCARSL